MLNHHHLMYFRWHSHLSFPFIDWIFAVSTTTISEQRLMSTVHHVSDMSSFIIILLLAIVECSHWFLDKANLLMFGPSSVNHQHLVVNEKF